MSEIQRLDWSNVSLTEGHIDVPATKLRPAPGALLPSQQMLLSGCEPNSKRPGASQRSTTWPSSPSLHVNTARKERAEKEGSPFIPFMWRRNALRHSFISYRVADVKAVDQVALGSRGTHPT